MFIRGQLYDTMPTHTSWSSPGHPAENPGGQHTPQAAANWYSMRRVPAPLPSTAPANVFSEERAMLHVRHLADVIGDRQVWEWEGASTAGMRGLLKS